MAQKPGVRTPVALAVLNLLREREMHPYEMRRLMQERGHHRLIKMRGGILYHTVERLHQAGLIEPTETSREGRYPERTVYRLTPRGADELADWMRELIAVPSEEYPWFTAALAFLPTLEREEAVEMLGRRTVHLAAQAAAEEAALHVMEPVLQRIHMIESEYALAMGRAELAWVTTLADDLRTGRIPWEFGLKEGATLPGHGGAPMA